MVVTCPACGAEVDARAKFCPECGARQAERPAPAREVRKLVTVLFSDVTGSTALGERLDPEVLRSLMTRYFSAMRGIIEDHGGTVEKFIGDAVMAVFGIPVVHEDDALRAVRAAWGLREALAAMNEDLQRERGISVQFRTGVNTGEVVAGDRDTGTTLVTGDTVNTAARLEQAAPPGEILLGRLTYSLVRDAVDAEQVEPVAAKGKSEPLDAFRLTGVRPGAVGRVRHLDAPIIARERELETLTRAWRRAVDDGIPQLVCVVAPAGVGKSRLVRAFTAEVGEVGCRILVGRCLSYGHGITYWPVRELVHAAAGIGEADTLQSAMARLQAIAPDDTVATRLASAIGLSSDAAPQEELFWAFRRLLEHLASEQPTLVILEDLHWAEDTLLDLVDYVIDVASGVPLVLLGNARPELVERRPGFAAGRESSTVIRLEPLGAEASGDLLDALPGGSAIPEPLRSRVLAAAEGNPLYVEEFTGLLRDEGRLVERDGAWVAAPGTSEVRVPPTVHTLLAARLEGLPDAERGVAQRASVMGRTFEVAALAELERPVSEDLNRRLLALVRKELLRPDRAELTPGDAFRFRHVLIRDAAYGALPKAERARLHERFAEWLVAASGDRLAEVEAILGSHLETAYRLQVELGERDERIRPIASLAATHLEGAGIRAAARGDVLGAIDLLTRAGALSPASPDADITLARAYEIAGAPDAAVTVLEQALDRARLGGDRRDLRRLTAALLEAQYWVHGSVDPAAVASLEAESSVGGDDPHTEMEVWRVRATITWSSGDVEASSAAIRGALAAALVVGLPDRVEEFEFELLLRQFVGATPYPEVIEAAEAFVGRPGLGPLTVASAKGIQALCYAIRLDGERARQEVAAAATIARDLGLGMEVARNAMDRAWIERLLEGPSAEADALADLAGPPLLRNVAELRRIIALARAGRLDESAALLDRRDLAGAPAKGHHAEEAMLMLVRARLMAARGETDAARLLVAEAVDVGRRDRQFLNAYGDVLRDAGDALVLAGDGTAARDCYAEALGVAERKGHLAAIRDTQQRLDALR